MVFAFPFLSKQILINELMLCVCLSQGLHVHGHCFTETYLTFTGQAMYELLVSFLLTLQDQLW